MQSFQKTLHFPHAGIATDLSYRESTAPRENGEAYASPFAVNVRGKCVFDGRRRGGSRPGFVMAGVVPKDGGGSWLWPNGEKIVWPDGADMSFGSLVGGYETASGARMVDPHETFLVERHSGDAPVGASVMSFYRGRAFLAKDSMWYCSRTGDTGDWDYGGDRDDMSRPAVGNCALADREGDRITALMAVDDRYLFIGTERSLWLVAGEPTDGMSVVSDYIGVSGPNAWCWTGKALVFLSQEGVYSVVPGDAPVLLSGKVTRIRGITDDDSPLMVYDPSENAVHLFTDAFDYFIDLETKAFWEVRLCSIDIHPIAACLAVVDGSTVPIFRCEDGEWRVFDADSDADETEQSFVKVNSVVAVGPVHSSSRDGLDGFIAELEAAFGVGSGKVTVSVATGPSAQQAVESAKTGSFRGEFVFDGGWNHVARPRARGAWCVMVLSSDEKWAYEYVHITCKQTGRQR